MSLTKEQREQLTELADDLDQKAIGAVQPYDLRAEAIRYAIARNAVLEGQLAEANETAHRIADEAIHCAAAAQARIVHLERQLAALDSDYGTLLKESNERVQLLTDQRDTLKDERDAARGQLGEANERYAKVIAGAGDNAADLWVKLQTAERAYEELKQAHIEGMAQALLPNVPREELLTRHREVLGKLVAKLDECEPHITSAFTLAFVHGRKYSGPSYGNEIKEARTLLAGQPRVEVPTDINAGRCTVVDPKYGWRCGDYEGHTNRYHTPLVPSGAPWLAAVSLARKLDSTGEVQA